MPIEQTRIEAAARVLAANDASESPEWGGFRDIASAALAAAFPELASDPPEAWLAPWEASEAMERETGTILSHFDGDYGEVNVYMDETGALEKLWGPIRDAHIKEQGE